MTEHWWRRRRRHKWLGDLFEEPLRIEKMKDDIISETLGSREKWKHRKPSALGFSSAFDSDAGHRLRRFGNSNSQLGRCNSAIREEPEPLVDILENGSDVVIVAELPGAKKEDIQIHATPRSLTISVDTMERRYLRELKLPTETNPESAEATYKNGVLQVRLKKLVDTQLLTS